MTHIDGHAGEQAVAAIRGFGVDVLFTLNGGHIWPLYEACRNQDVRVFDTRHEQSATFAAEAYAKLTRQPGIAALTAGPGITNGVSAVTSAWFNGSPLLVLGGRAPQARWGAGSLQELDHVPILASITKSAATVHDAGKAGVAVHEAIALAIEPHRGPVFLDFPLDVFGPSGGDVPDVDVARQRGALGDPDAIAALGGRRRGCRTTGVRRRQRRLLGRRRARAGGRGRAPPGPRVHERAGPWHPAGGPRAGVPAARVVGSSRAPTSSSCSGRRSTSGSGSVASARRPWPTSSTPSRSGRPTWTCRPSPATSSPRCARSPNHAGPRADHEAWIGELRAAEEAVRADEAPLLEASGGAVKPTRIYGELRKRLARDAVVICDGGDFASYAGKYVEVFEPGCWLDTGPYGCLGNGMGYSMAARVARPDAQVVTLLGDGAAGFSLMDADSLVRQGLPVVMVVGNNGMWGLEKHPMQAIYGWDVACDLQPGCRYDEVVTALGGGGELVTEPDEVGPALDRAFSSGVPYVVNVVTDPTDVYPRSSNLG